MLAAATLLTFLLPPTGVAGQATPNGDGLAPLAEARGEVGLRAVSVGVDGVTRPGEWVGVLVEVTETSTRSRNAIIRLRAFDRDGDIPLYDREISTTAGATQFVWIYARLPAAEVGWETLEITCHEGIEVEGGPARPVAAGSLAFRAGELLGRAVVQTPGFGTAVGAYGVIGFSPFGIDQYGFGLTGPGQGDSTTQNERTRVAANLSLDDLPDRWHGLSVFEAVVWGPGPAETDPLRLSPERAAALVQWVQRGGHLVVILPTLGQPWSTPQNPLYGIMPAIGPLERREDVDYERYRRLLTDNENTALPTNGVVQVMRRAEGAGAQEAMPVLAGPEGEVVAMRRLVGGGAVTLIGLDLQNSRLRSAGLPRADALWNRILGRRGPVLAQSELESRDGSGAARRGRSTTSLDRDIEDAINQSAAAALGVLVGVVMFVAYWLAAGPAGFWILKASGRLKHAWVIFVATSAVFTAAAWLIATAIRPQKVRAQHVALYEHVYGQPVARGRAWSSVLVPYYGQVALEVPTALPGDGEGEDQAPAAGVGVDPLDPLGPTAVFGRRGTGNLLTAWESPTRALGLTEGFPDNRAYRVDARRPDGWSAPARQTIKQVRTDWAGRPVSGGIRPVREPGDIDEARIVWDRRPADATGPARGPILRGRLAHDFPAPLQDVEIIVVERQRTLPRPGASIGERVLANAWAASLPDPWLPATSLDLEAVTQRTGVGRIGSATGYLSRLADSGVPEGLVRGASRPLEYRLKAASLFGQLDPPDVDAESTLGATSPRVVRRRETFGYDMGRWFTQPCVIVLGVLRQDAAERTPVPLLVNGNAPESSGVTLVRWVYPLEPMPPRYQTEGDADAGEDDERGAGTGSGGGPSLGARAGPGAS